MNPLFGAILVRWIIPNTLTALTNAASLAKQALGHLGCEVKIRAGAVTVLTLAVSGHQTAIAIRASASLLLHITVDYMPIFYLFAGAIC